MDDPSSAASLADRIIGHYERHAHHWDADRRAAGWNDKPWHDRFVAALPHGGTVLDLGCGGGDPVALNMANRGLHVTGVDASASLIALCQDRMPGQEWIVGDIRTLALGRQFDGLLAWDSFFHLAPGDQRRMFDIFAAHAAPSSLLMFNAGPACGEALGCYRDDPLYHASLEPSEYETHLAQAGFAIIDHVAKDPDAGGRTAWLACFGPGSEAATPGHS